MSIRGGVSAPRHSCATSQFKAYGISRLTVRGGAAGRRVGGAASQSFENINSSSSNACHNIAKPEVAKLAQPDRVEGGAVNLCLIPQGVVKLSANLMRLSHRSGGAGIR